jgi:hypothetical protein
MFRRIETRYCMAPLLADRRDIEAPLGLGWAQEHYCMIESSIVGKKVG